MEKGLFPLTPHNWPRQPGRRSARASPTTARAAAELEGSLQGRDGVFAPQRHTLDTASVSASSSGTLEDPLSALCT